MAKRSINLLNDLVPPIAVTAVNIAVAHRGAINATSSITWQQIANYVMAGGGYAAYYMGYGGKYSEMLKNLGIAAAPGALIALYNAIAKPATPYSIQRNVRRVAMNRVARYPAPAPESPFQGVRLV